jgi:hypothetical protein
MTPKLQEKPSASIYLWIIFALLDPDQDPATQINADPDPHLWFLEVISHCKLLYIVGIVLFQNEETSNPPS